MKLGSIKMVTFIHLKSGTRYPEYGCACWMFQQWSNNSHTWEHHIKPGYPHCTNGWKKADLKDWVGEIIPDLQKPFTDEQFREYAKQYGVIVAQEFLDCCSYYKPTMASNILNPSKTKKIWEEHHDWFRRTFKCAVWAFAEPLLITLGNIYSFDIIKFERFLTTQFRYNPNSDESMSDFMKRHFGTNVEARFRRLAFPKE